MISSLVNLFLLAVIALACIGLGRYALRKAGFLQGLPIIEALALSLGIGLAVLVYSLAVLGGLRALYPAAAWSLLGVIGVAAFLSLRRLRVRDAAVLLIGVRSFSRIDLLLVLVGAAMGLAYLVVALTPTLEGDSLSGYLLIPREYARSHSLGLVDDAWGAAFPQNGQLISVFGFLLRGQVLAQLLVAWLPSVLALATVYAIGRTLLSTRASLVAVAIWYGMYATAYLAPSAKIDLAWAAFDLLALLSFSRWYFARPDDRRWGWLVLAGLFLGVAGGTKYASVYTAMALAMAIAVCLWQQSERRPREWVRAYLALGLPAMLAGMWVVRSYLLTGEPAYTAAGHLSDSGVVGFFRTLWQMSMLGNAVGVEGPLSKSIGPTIVATLPLFILFRNVDRRVWHILAFCGLVLVFWFFGVQRARHLLPTLGLLSLLAGYAVMLLLTHRPRLGQAVLVLILVSVSLNLANWGYVNLMSTQRLPYVVGLQDEAAYLDANLPKRTWLPNYAMVAYARDHLSAKARIAALSTRNGYYLDRPFYVGWEDTTTRMPDDDRFADQLRQEGITHVFVNDFVVGALFLGDAWLNQPEFQREHLRRLICADGQCLYAVLPASASVAAN